ncbi:ABC transporter permease, partial [Rhizobium sp. CG4]|nr:ABC transporter permease [Rhizobium sp. CG4]
MSSRRVQFNGWAEQIGTIAVTLLGLLMLTFFIGRMMPADPVRAIVGEDATRETYEQVFRSLGLDRPVWEQFFLYLRDVLTGNFGTS